jgi:glutamate/aspartate transport system substrate-binding protein
MMRMLIQCFLTLLLSFTLTAHAQEAAVAGSIPQPVVSTEPAVAEVTAAVEEEFSFTLTKINQLGTIYLGYRESAVPFSYLHEGRATGYSVDLCYRIIDAIKLKLGRADLKTAEVPLPGNLRFTMLIDGIVDMECGASTNTRIRQQRMAFGVTTFVAGLKMLVAKESKLDRILDLDRKQVAIIAGTTGGRAMATATARRNIGVRQLQVRDRSEALDLLKKGKVDAFVGDDALLLGVLLKDPDRDKFRLMEEALSTEPYGIALRREDPQFKKLVDDVLTGLMKSGEIEKIYDKWFMQPVPPSGNSMDLPLSPMLKEMFANPNDAGV